jgi:hypothetical protein
MGVRELELELELGIESEVSEGIAVGAVGKKAVGHPIPTSLSRRRRLRGERRARDRGVQQRRQLGVLGLRG